MPLAVHVDWLAVADRRAGFRRLVGNRAQTMLGGDHATLALVPLNSVSRLESSLIAGQIAHVSLVADARIDNLSDLHRLLGSGADEPPADTLIRAYLRWGDIFPDRISGDFAIVLWDDRRRGLLACRDPFGVRPLFYRAAKSAVVLGTRLEQILRTLDVPPMPEGQMIVEYLLWRYKTTDATFFREIDQVRPGHVLTATTSGTRLERYWFPPSRESNQRTTRSEDYDDEFRRLFVQSVKRRLRSSEPVMIHVSGGLDSSAIAAAADEIACFDALPCPSIRGVAGLHPGLTCDERPFIDAVAQWVRFPIEHWDASEADVTELLSPAIEDPGSLPLIGGTKGDLAIAKTWGSSVILSGLGGDQLTMPMGVTRDMISAHDWVGALQVLFLFKDATLRTRLGRLKTVAEQFAPLSVQNILAKVRAESPDWLVPDLRTMAGDLATREATGLSFFSYLQAQTWERLSSPYTARAIDTFQRLGGEFGVEYRFPYLDQDLVRFVLTIPYRHWPRPDPFARLHRRALQRMFPPKISGRFGKAEFTPALANRVERSEQRIQALLEDGYWASGRYVDRAIAERQWKLTRRGGRTQLREWRQIWAIVTLEAWLRQISRYYPQHE